MSADYNPGYLTKLKWSLPWLARYPLWRVREVVRRITDEVGPQHIIMLVANHFEPAWYDKGAKPDLTTQSTRLERWCRLAEKIGDAVRDHDRTPFRHTLFYPGEEYHAPLLERMAALQRDGFGEVEIHLHHGVERPDTAENLRRALLEFRDRLAEEHACLSRLDGKGSPMYAFVHGNLALGNSAGGRFCGVDSEMSILAETGCYADFTLPSAPDQSQVPRLNTIYQCGHPLGEARPHRSGPSLRVGETGPLLLPLIFTGPLVFNWRRRVRGVVPVPRIDDGTLAGNYPPDLARFEGWRGARIGVRGMPSWVFIKLYCHGFFPQDEAAMIGDGAQRFLETLLELSEQSSSGFKVHFATAREAFNMVLAAVEGRATAGTPHDYRDYRLRPIMREGALSTAATTTATARAPQEQEEEESTAPAAQAL
ncbi:MAG TPA: hypothetical protein VGX92_18235 [Pyrinomonadaceae bacterium]|jgi:hypothetical protein|nr:hypothetical protein [Pyrinomonadaceae bacterium]